MRPKSSLRDAQQRTITRLYEEPAVQAVLGMGAGKTACGLTAFAELQADGLADALYVLAPKRVSQLVWPAEPRLWEHLQHLKVVYVAGTEKQRLKALQEPADVYAIGVDNTQWFVLWLQEQPPEKLKRTVFCIDESSRFKNPRGKRGKALAKFTDKKPFFSIWELTGTPRPNSTLDQFMPMRILTASKLWGRSFDKWRRENFFPTDWEARNWEPHPHKEPKLLADINTVSITIPTSEMPDLPLLNDGPEFIEWVDMPAEAMAVYKRMKTHLVAEIKAKKIAAANLAVATGKLEQIAQGFLYDEAGLAERIHEAKMEVLQERIESAGGEPLVIAYWFEEDLAQLEKAFGKRPTFGAGTTDKQAVDYEAAWNKGNIELMFAQPSSIGHGLNLQFGGAQLSHYCLTWSAELYDQLVKRFHRPGQTKPCFSRPILMRGTVDEIKYERVRNKISAQAAFQQFINEV